jgi:arylsulfatase A-like enzyme
MDGFYRNTAVLDRTLAPGRLMWEIPAWMAQTDFPYPKKPFARELPFADACTAGATSIMIASMIKTKKKRTNTKEKRAMIKTLEIPLLVAALLAAEVSIAQAEGRPNVVLVVCDDLAIKALGAYGGTLIPTPNLDRLAAGGARFDRCYVSNSFCAPSRAVILTGKYSHLNGVKANGMKFDGSQQTLQKLLQAGGYQTAVVGKWHLYSDPVGFDYWQVLQGQGVYNNPSFETRDGPIKREGHSTGVITDDALAWLERRDAARPFFLSIGYKAPHSPWIPEAKFKELFKDKTFPEPDSLHEDLSSRTPPIRHIETTLDPDGILKYEKAFARLVGEVPPGLNPAETRSWIFQQYMRNYLGTVAGVDEHMGRLLNWLDKAGLAEDTLVLFTSDQGYFLGEHGFYSKQLMYDEAYRTPLLVRLPGVVKPGTVVDEMAINVDFAQTVLDFAGLPQPEDMQGMSLRPLVDPSVARPRWRDAVYYRFYHTGWGHTPHEGVLTGKYKLIRFFHFAKAPREEFWELYDVRNDPREMHNLYDEASPELKQQLVRKMIELRHQYGVPDDNSDLLFNMGPKVPPLAQ